MSFNFTGRKTNFIQLTKGAKTCLAITTSHFKKKKKLLEPFWLIFKFYFYIYSNVHKDWTKELSLSRSSLTTNASKKWLGNNCDQPGLYGKWGYGKQKQTEPYSWSKFHIWWYWILSSLGSKWWQRKWRCNYLGTITGSTQKGQSWQYKIDNRKLEINMSTLFFNDGIYLKRFYIIFV